MEIEELIKYFVVEHGGPNEYYKCLKCNSIEPGIVEYLKEHVEKCNEESTKCP